MSHFLWFGATNLFIGVGIGESNGWKGEVGVVLVRRVGKKTDHYSFDNLPFSDIQKNKYIFHTMSKMKRFVNNGMNQMKGIFSSSKYFFFLFNQ
jgi:hypothetical protein